MLELNVQDESDPWGQQGQRHQARKVWGHREVQYCRNVECRIGWTGGEARAWGAKSQRILLDALRILGFVPRSPPKANNWFGFSF